jgi:hypothetical protein
MPEEGVPIARPCLWIIVVFVEKIVLFCDSVRPGKEFVCDVRVNYVV